MVYSLVVHLYAKDDPEAIKKLSAKLQEASQVYSNDKETVSWSYYFALIVVVENPQYRFVMQDHKDPRAFTIVERYANESSQKYHLENPYWQTFDPYVKPLLAQDMDLRRFNELDTSEEVRVEDDAELWKKVKEHQTY